MSKKGWHIIVILLIFILLIPYPLFHGLDAMVLRIWDEARRGVNAFEMLQNGNLLVTYYNGKPDMWGTKPSLFVLIQTGFMWLLGPGELAVRLPSALAGLFTCLFLLYLSWKYLKNPYYGLIWAVVLITFNGYVDFHGTRTGDFDALLTLFMFLSAFFFFLYTEEKTPRALLYSILFLTLAALTKGIGGLLFLPALFIWAIYKKNIKEIIYCKMFWVGAAVFVSCIGGYYFLREIENPGYLQAVMNNELGGRYLKGIEGHDQGFLFYVEGFIYPRLQKWAVFIIPGIVAGFFIKERQLKNLHLYSIILFISHLLIISASGTKLRWYDLPEYPFIAFIITGFIWLALTILWKYLSKVRQWLAVGAASVFLLIIFYEPVRLTFKEANYIQERPWYLEDHEIAKFLREGVRNQRDLDGYVLVHKGYDAHCLFYMYLLKEHGQTVIRKSKEQLKAGDKVIAHETEVKDYIQTHYPAEITDSSTYVKVYYIGD